MDEIQEENKDQVDVGDNMHEIADVCLGKSSMEGIQKQILLANFENKLMRNELKI